MQYIVLDMEWNQAWPGSNAARSAPGLRGEIIQIGAVRLLEDRTLGGEFQILVQPRFFRRLNRKISQLTGIRESQLKSEGLPFPEALEKFLNWCGEDFVILTWGFDDVMILRDNLRMYRMEDNWTANWYNAQLLFNAQTDGASAQRSLMTALEMLEIEPSRPAHDALGDAYHTALICAKLDLQKGIDEYRALTRRRGDAVQDANLPGCVQRKVIHGYADREDALTRLGGEENLCPVCGAELPSGRWLAQRGQRYMQISVCPKHGKFLIRIHLQHEDSTLRANKLVYDESSELLKAYEAQLSSGPVRRRRRRRKSST